MTPLSGGGDLSAPSGAPAVTDLLYFCHSAAEQLDVARADDLSVFAERLRGVVFALELDEGVAGGPAVGLLHEEDPLLGEHHLTTGLTRLEKLQLQERRR